MDKDTKELYEIVGFLFVQNRKQQEFQGQLEQVLQNKDNQINERNQEIASLKDKLNEQQPES